MSPPRTKLLAATVPLVRSVYAVSTNDGGLQQDGGAVVLAVRPLSKGPYTCEGDGVDLIRDEDELQEIQEGFRVACDSLILPLLTTKLLERKGSVEMMYFPRGMRKDYLFNDQSIGGFCVKVTRTEDDHEIRVTLTTSRRYVDEAAFEDPMSESPWEVAVERPAKRYRTAGSALRDVFDKRNS